MKKVVLVTAIGTVTSTAIVRQLKSTGEYYLIGADINPQNEIATSLDVDEFYTFPLAGDEGYLPFVLDFCKSHKVEYYFAVIDKEVVTISAHRDEFLKNGTKLCVVDYAFAEACHYKNKFGRWVEKNIPQVAVKEYKTLDEAKNAAYPLFIKPVEGAASAGCRKINSYEELKTYVSSETIGSEILVQEYVSGENITVDCIRNRKTGQMMQIQRRELLRNGNGCGIAVELFSDAVLQKICNEFMEKLDLNGVVNIEFFATENGYRIIEVNPRFSAGTMYSCLGGVNTVLNAVYIADGQNCIFGQLAAGAHFAERYEAYRMD